MKLTLQNLAEAACKNDETSNTQGVEDLMKGAGLEYKDACYIAEQRALRAILLLERRQKLPDKFTPIELTAEELKLLDKYTIMFLDGLACGIVATQKAIKENN